MRQLRFAVICVLPLATAAGLLVGGAWCWLGLAVYLALYLVWDAVGPKDRSPPAARGGAFADALLFAQVPLLLAAWLGFLAAFGDAGAPIAALAGARHDRASQLAGAFFSFAVTIAIAGTITAHELVHRTRSPLAVLAGRVLLAFSFDASFAIEHVYGHHVKVGTWEDPATARRGESLYRFILRSTAMSFRSAWAIERERLARQGAALWSWRNRNLRGLGLSLALLAATALLAGWAAAAAFVLAGALAKALLETTNYVEHYGLVRVAGTRIEPRHSWDTAAPLCGAGMFNLGRHASHHVTARPYWALALDPGAPHLPAGLLLSGAIAAVPPLWRRKMAKRLARWDSEMATEAERALAAVKARA